MISRCEGYLSAFAIPQMAERADNAPADLVDHPGNVGIAGRRDLDKARREALVRAIDIDALEGRTPGPRPRTLRSI